MIVFGMKKGLDRMYFWRKLNDGCRERVNGRAMCEEV
jgi:hypothetical protein